MFALPPGIFAREEKCVRAAGTKRDRLLVLRATLKGADPVGLVGAPPGKDTKVGNANREVYRGEKISSQNIDKHYSGRARQNS